MALKKGTKAPDFTLAATGDKKITLSRDFEGKALIVYFYPKDFTRVCTAEACEFRDKFEDFRDLSIPILGISKDDIPSHEKFKKEYKLPFDLLSDPSGKVCKAYDALVPLIKMPKRITYLLNEKHEIEASFSEMFEAKSHIESMLKNINKKA
ncbi:peroxiredoxin Q/BCP [Algoriphagus iocasae]|uniref:thioredoxin-dependent peroxiredoxin n=1 Tax=Algoriphagus iocasae TaxID=1836499 RepID=A0A841MKQ3_9BACT|nr:peroxiredoxin [Algoriphagus iocasae]MBB6328020.1 peroxiredoxin Q/BCP [Algoriphagus iocasae]